LRGAGLKMLLLALVLAATGCQRKSEPQLPALGVKLEGTTVSGLSAGAYMAGQFQLAHSRLVTGAGLIAGGPYACAESVHADAMPGPATVFLNASKATNGCMLDTLRAWGIPNPDKLADRARQLAQQGRIDPIGDLVGDRIYLFSGKADRVVVPAIVEAAAQFYAAAGVPREAIELVTGIGAGHGVVTETKGLTCGETGSPYLNACGYDQIGAMLKHLYGTIQPPAADPRGELISFDQKRFTEGLAEHGLAGSGALYVPASCRQGAGCRVHVAFHGCNQSRSAAGDAFVSDAGYPRWAETNRLVVLFPQVDKSPLNPQGCWDWWGYTGRDYLTRDAPQIVAVRRMLDRLAQPFAGS